MIGHNIIAKFYDILASYMAKYIMSFRFYLKKSIANATNGDKEFKVRKSCDHL